VIVYGYARVSTERQTDESVSLEEQLRRIEGRARERRWQIAEVFIERGVSGTIPLGNRPAGARLLAALQPADIVIAAKFDRMFRSASNALDVICDFQRRRVSLWLLDLDANVAGGRMAKAVLTILVAVAEAERQPFGERIRDAKRNQRRSGQYIGGDRPFGWRIGENGVLVEDEAEQRALVEMRNLRSAGGSYRAIAEHIRKVHGLQISHMAVKRAVGRSV